MVTTQNRLVKKKVKTLKLLILNQLKTLNEQPLISFSDHLVYE